MRLKKVDNRCIGWFKHGISKCMHTSKKIIIRRSLPQWVYTAWLSNGQLTKKNQWYYTTAVETKHQILPCPWMSLGWTGPDILTLTTLQGCCKARIRWGGNPWALWKAMLKEHWSFPACLRPEFWYKRGSSFLLDLGLHYSPPDLRKDNMCTWFQQQERSLCQYAWDYFLYLWDKEEICIQYSSKSTGWYVMNVIVYIKHDHAPSHKKSAFRSICACLESTTLEGRRAK